MKHKEKIKWAELWAKYALECSNPYDGDTKMSFYEWLIENNYKCPTKL